jgi:hypothetical protein
MLRVIYYASFYTNTKKNYVIESIPSQASYPSSYDVLQCLALCRTLKKICYKNSEWNLVNLYST